MSCRFSSLGVLFLTVFVAATACSGKPEVVRENASSANAGNAGTISLDSGAPFFPVVDSGAGGSGACAGDACAPQDVCGDAIIGKTETCDDGNSVPADGCSGVCSIEAGYTCPTAGEACVYTVTKECGNGLIEGNEVCDDGNAQNGDGCNSTCDAVEDGWVCGNAGEPCVRDVAPAICGDGLVGAGEQCDDGDAPDAGTSNGDGCTQDCKLEAGYTCPTPGSPCVKLEYCGDAIVQANETCDDGNAIPGDGCSGVCQKEPGYSCPTPGAVCVNIWVCGNGKVDPGETCDDGGTVDKDGCTANCTVEPGNDCPSTGGVCQPVKNICGDAIIADAETCDDGGKKAGDGCDASCKVETGWTCPTPGAPCKKTPYCGSGIVDLDVTPKETCDDGNTKANDGCSPLCQIETGYSCPTPGSPCVSTVKCPDGKIGGTEQCDDGNSKISDGCDASCKLEPGWVCPVAGARCVPKCGDGKVISTEQCDDGNGVNADGCGNDCKLQPGFACTTAANSPTVCHKTTCGDGTKEGFEQCDDHNLIPYDGCSPSCTIEPSCASGKCTAVCGDGFKFPQEDCDDGNLISGDGCDASCIHEPFYTCTTKELAPPSSLVIPILYRDFRARGTTDGHPDFEWNIAGATGLVEDTLASDGLPVYKSSRGSGGKDVITDATSFYWWYHDTLVNGGTTTDSPYGKLIYTDTNGNPTTLTLGTIGSGSYQFTDGSFFPVDDLGWNAVAGTKQVSKADDGLDHNFHFTSELRFQFTYKGGEVLDFTGDDDVWVFINGKLAVDIGGVHGAQNGSVTLNAANATKLGLVKDGMYEIVLFQAERHTTASNYRLTLSGFVHAISDCPPICGDGVVTSAEVCDDGVNDGKYGGCMPGCKARSPYCGDKKVTTPPEGCDDGTNLGSYGDKGACAPGCKPALSCGDSVVSNGEECDDGAKNGTGYGFCTAACRLGDRCGDGFTNGPEQCDAGINNGASASPCDSGCRLKCGNHVVDAGEECDDGIAGNVGGYNHCNANCTFAPRCGDGIKNNGETCDDGKNDGSYGTCTTDCKVAGFCGDHTTQNPPEGCDLGAANSSSAYGPNTCTNRCTTPPRCGDKAVDGLYGEVCDDGVNSGKPGSCSTDCKRYIPLSSCGDGNVKAPEVCDDGSNNGTIGSTCDIHCRVKCGNGFKDEGEQCDNGVNDGSYGTCKSDCTLAGYCGDNTKNGAEQCDSGGRNVAIGAYGAGLCTKACVPAAYCGDGRIQTDFEECDGTPGCTSSCRRNIAH